MDETNGAYEGILTRLNRYGRDSESVRTSLETVWIDNLLLMQGRFSKLSSVESQVRRRNASFYRLGWAARQEILAAIHTAYLKDERTVSIVPSNEFPPSLIQANVLDYMISLHTQVLRRDWDLQSAHITAAGNCLDFGFCAGRFLIFPAEKVAPPYNIGFEIISPDRILLDWGRGWAQGRFAIVEHWLCEEEISKFVDVFSFFNLDSLVPNTRPDSVIQDLRMGFAGPHWLGRSGAGEALSPSDSDKLYKIWECYLKVYMGGRATCLRMFTNEYANVAFTSPTPMGSSFPIVLGQSMLNPDVISGETLASVVRDPQETFNELMNSRLDNLALTLRPTRMIQRGLGIDKYELARAAAGDIIDVDAGPNLQDGIYTFQVPDVTQGAFQEAQNAADLIRGLAGLPDQLTGTSGTPEGVISQVYQAAAKKIDFLIGTFSQTYWRPWHDLLLELVVNNDSEELFQQALQNALMGKPDAQQYQGFNPRQHADLNCQVVLAHATKQLPSDLELYTNLINQASSINQQTVALVNAGLQPREKTMLFDSVKMLAYTMDKAGIRGAKDFMIAIPPPPPPPPPPPIQGTQQTQQTQVLEPTGVARQINRITTKFPVTKEAPQQQGPEAPPGAPPGG